MRMDKLTTKFQEALGEAQTLALANDHAYIEPAHLVVAMLRQEDGPAALLQRAGVNTPGLQASAEAAMHKLPPVKPAKTTGGIGNENSAHYDSGRVHVLRNRRISAGVRAGDSAQGISFPAAQQSTRQGDG